MKPFSVAIIEMRVPFRSDVAYSIPKFIFLKNLNFYQNVSEVFPHSPINNKPTSHYDEMMMA